MKKVIFLLLVTMIISGCATGFYAPHNVNQFGTQTQVVLSQANFRIVKNLEVVISINNDNLKRADVEKSAYAELLRRANLTGSQALINVVIEEVRRESFRGFNVKQHVAARATVIEFFDENHHPLSSTEPQPTKSVVSNKTPEENSDIHDRIITNESNDISEQREDLLNSPIYNYPEPYIIFNDPSLMQACLQQIDKNSDGKISKEEIIATTELRIPTWRIKDMNGIELFENLEFLDARFNDFTELDLSKNKNLKKVMVKSKKLTKVYLPKGINPQIDFNNNIVRK